MSHYASVAVQITNRDALLAALCEMFGTTLDKIRVSDTPIVMRDGYYGKEHNERQAHIVVSAQVLGSAARNSLGFLLDEQTAQWSIIHDDYDAHYYWDKLLDPDTRRNFIPSLMKEYAKHTVLQQAQKLGHSAEVVQRADGGYSIRVKPSTRSAPVRAGQQKITTRR